VESTMVRTRAAIACADLTRLNPKRPSAISRNQTKPCRFWVVTEVGGLMNRALSSCPVCSESLFISELSCESCGTRIKGSFRSCNFCRLTPDQLQFLEVFLASRGNLSG